MSAVPVRTTSQYPKGSTPPKYRVHSSPADVSFIAFTGVGTIHRATITNTTGTAGYLQIHDALTLPADTAVPVFSKQIPANGSVDIEDIYCATGAVFAISTTAGTLTISTNAAFFSANVTK